MNFNHAMVYVRDVDRAVEFYAGQLGLTMIEAFPGGYARLKCPEGNGTLALHSAAEDNRDPRADGIRLYFEVKDLDAFCEKLAARGVKFDQMPQDMPWGWRHAYLHDPEGHEISLYWAGEKRLRASQ